MDDQYRSAIAQLFQNPQLMSQLGMTYRPSTDQAFTDSANNMDFGKVNAIKRLLGLEIDPNTRVREDFGALQAMRRY